MKFLLTLVLAVCWLKLYAQEPAGSSVYNDTKAHYRLTYPDSWQRQQSEDKTGVTLHAGSTERLADIALTSRPLPPEQKVLASLLARGQQDTLWRSILRLPRVQVLQLEQRTASTYEELRYEYTYAAQPAPAPRTRVVGRQLWRSGVEFNLEYRAATTQDGRYLTEGAQVVESFLLTGSVPTPPVPVQQCDDKMYGIAALRIVNDTWEDDCRTIHEFSVTDPSESPKIHREVLPFQSYALAKGFDNCLYSVTKAPTNRPELVYRYNPTTKKGEYTTWRLPAQGSETVWISAATDEHGNLYFMTADANKLVKVSPADNSVTVLWTKDPARQTPYFSTIGFAGAGSHGNFCIDDANTLYEVYSTDGSLLKVNISTRQAAPEMIALSGLPERGGYSDLLLQLDKAGRRRLYMAGPKSLYRVNMETGEAYRVRRGVYTDLAGCNLFRAVPPPPPKTAAGAPPAAPTATTWRGRVLDAVTLQPLPQALLRLNNGKAETKVQLTAEGTFAVPVTPDRAYRAHAQLVSYLPTDSIYTTLAGPYVQDILLQPLTVGTTLRLKNVQFDQGTTRMLAASYATLDQLIAVMKEDPSLLIEIRGHTDNVGPPEKNQILSEQRAAAVRIYLVGLGISEQRITSVGFGGSLPRASNARESTRQLNRRVEFRVTGGR
ncbi:OmpA family protein [Hymenobacter tibetensis]|uniref:OmpA family protein n=1 Tax=Hymenobacter tibetensis TaxID=497967 RepID=A0ABY4CSB7_9BACT|nr:OmpA family protein [Hymenobacter tibetensis]UOG72952.1 OmpA family protein [Hymenobacter tibetensis]